MISKIQIQWLNENIDIISCLEDNGIKVHRNGKIFCPFHMNINTPAAKVFEDGNSIYCFTERKKYNAYDYLMTIYSEEDIVKMIPDTINVEELDFSSSIVRIPIIKKDIRDSYKNNIFGFLAYMDESWKDKDNVECIIL